MFYVNVTSPSGSGPRKVDGETFTVGRSDESDLVVAHETLSRRHLVIRQRGFEVFVEDQGSANGTFVNGQRITARVPIGLDPEDEITMGESEVRLTVSADLPTVIMSPVQVRAATAARPPVDHHAVTRLNSEAPRPVVPAAAPDIRFEDDVPVELPRSKVFPQLAAGLGVICLVAMAGWAFRHSSESPAAPVTRQVASMTPPAVPPPPAATRPLPSRYRSTYVDNVLATPRFVETYLGDEFQTRLNRELVPRAVQSWRVDQTKIVQALGITAELVKSLGELRGDGSPGAEPLETMRRLEADADLQLIEVLGAKDRAAGLRAFEKSLFER